MPTEAVITMVIIVGIVWGGLATILTVALRKERQKRSDDNEA